jgi:hypothetical protein
MITLIREKVFNFILKRQTKRSVSIPQWDEVRSVVILYPNNSIQHIVKQIEAASKDVTLYITPNQQEVNWLTGVPKKDLQESIRARKYDVLIDLTQQPSRTMQYMAMYAHADFKVGRHNLEEIYDMIIDTPAQETPDFLYEQIVRYIKMFGSK